MISAIRKRGTVMPRKEMAESVESIQEYWRVAAHMPKVMPSTEASRWQTSWPEAGGGCSTTTGRSRSGARSGSNSRSVLLGVQCWWTAPLEIGSIIALSANISGAAGGCQNEVGVASSMGAAAVAYMMGGSTRQSIHAAALALKNTLGLVCDPVGGLVEVPCVKRNALFAVHGLTAAQLAMAGVDSVIPMDEIVEAMVRIGRALPRGLKETAEGGLATTLTGCEIGQRLKDEANQRRAERAAERERVAKERKSGSTLS